MPSPHWDDLVDGYFLEAEAKDAIELGQQEGQAGLCGDLRKHLRVKEGGQADGNRKVR